MIVPYDELARKRSVAPRRQLMRTGPYRAAAVVVGIGVGVGLASAVPEEETARLVEPLAG